MTDEIVIRGYQPGDEHGLAALFGRCFRREISAEYWLWKLKSHSADFENVFVVTVGDRYVGQYVGVPVDAWVRGGVRPAIDICDTMVDPSMRRRGVLTRMGQYAHDSWRNAGVEFGYGLPNQQWGSRAAAIGWLELYPLPWLMRVLRPEAFLARRTGLLGLSRFSALGAAWRRVRPVRRPDPGIAFESLSNASAELDVVADAATKRSVLSLVRGAAWVERRYLSSPGAEYRVILARRDQTPVGYAVYRIHRNAHARAVITEVVSAHDDEAAFDSLVAAIESQALGRGVDAIVTLAVAGTEDYERWRRNGFTPRKHAFSLQYVPLNDELSDKRDLRDWRFLPGDFDVV